jgi:hypothetical protein
MDSPEPHKKGRRSRLIAIAAGLITITAVVLSFASGYLGLGWQWLRPAAELLLLAELVGLIVLERHQLFEPATEKIAGIENRIELIGATLEALDERLTTAGQATFCANSSQTLSVAAHTVRDTIAREQETPQVLRYARLGAAAFYQLTDPEVGHGFQELINSLWTFALSPGSLPDSRARLWSCRFILTMRNLANFESYCENILREVVERKVLNFELKFLVRSRDEAVLSPNLITDRDVLLTFDDANAPTRWGLLLQGRQYVTVFARWFDELWASIPDAYVVYSRNGLRQAALDRIRKELEAAEASGDRRTA